MLRRTTCKSAAYILRGQINFCLSSIPPNQPSRSLNLKQQTETLYSSTRQVKNQSLLTDYKTDYRRHLTGQSYQWL